MGFMDNIRGIKPPSPKTVLAGIKESQQTIKNIEVNKINVRLFNEHGSNLFIRTIGERFHFPGATLVKIESPSKLGVLIQDGSIAIDQTTSIQELDVRKDYPLSLSINLDTKKLLESAMATFPDVTEWYIPGSIHNIPVKNVIIRRDMTQVEKDKKMIEGVGIARNILDWIDQLPVKFEVTTEFLYNISDVHVIGSLKQENDGFHWVEFIIGGLFFALLTMAFMTYIGR